MAVTDKATFILNNEYKEQVDMLNDVQAGQLFRAILQYANGQSIDKFADPTVGMMFSFVRQQMDKDYKKYAEVCQKRAEAGRKGGLQKAKNRAEAINATEDADVVTASYAETFVANVADSDCESDCDSDCDLYNNKTGRHHRQVEENTRVCEEITPVDKSVDKSVDKCTDTIIMPYGKAALSILASEQERYKTFANGLTRKYMNRSAKAFDMQKVIFYASQIAVSSENEVYAMFDIDRAELLEYVFERAAEQERMTWKYIDGIMENYAIRDVHTVREAIKNEADWHAGNISV